VPSFAWRIDATSAYPAAKLIVHPPSAAYKPRGIGGLFDSGATIHCFTLQEQGLLRVKDPETVPCPSRVADNSVVVGKLIVLNGSLEGDTHKLRLPIVFLPPSTQVLIGRVGLFNHFDIHHDPVNWLTEFEWRGPQAPPKRFPPLPTPPWSTYWEQKAAEQLALGRSWTAWEAAGRPEDWLAHWNP